MTGVAGALALAAALASGPSMAQSVLKAVPHADLKVLDTHVGSIQITKIFSLMVYDQLFAWDEKWHVKPQMVGDWQVSPDKLTYTFKLRAGQKWHDGTKVTAKDVVPSVQRWAKRDAMGQKLLEYTAAFETVDDDTFRIRLKEPYGFVEFTLGSAGGSLPVIYREKDAMTDAFTGITTTIGSGPFKFNREGWQPGSKIVFDKNTDYVPRNEPADGLAGGKVVKVGRIDWTIMPDPGTSAAALGRGEVDLWDNPPGDQIPILEKNKDVVVAPLTPFGNMGFLRTNALYPPFNNPKARLALAYAFDQRDFQRASTGDDERWWKVCYSFFICGTPYGTEFGSEAVQKVDLAKAKQLMAEAGYKGEKLIMITTNEIAAIGALAQVATARLKEIGVNVDMQVADWGSVVTRMTKKDEPEKGGWHMFTSRGTASTYHHPLTNITAVMTCDGKNWNGWPCDEEAEKLRNAFIREADETKRKEILNRFHARLVEVQPYALLGNFMPLYAWRKNVDGVVKGAILAYWNISKS
jgi:peptide/nickel transport system substrate-binding protein